MMSVFLSIGHFDETVGGMTADSVRQKEIIHKAEL